MATKDELIEKAKELGVELKGEETNIEIGELIKAKVLADEKDAEELKKESDRVTAEKAAKDEEKRLARIAAEGKPGGEKLYTQADVQEMLKLALQEMKARGNDAFDDPNNLDDDEPFKQKTVTIPRFMNKFILAFKNTNTDEYYKDTIIHAFDVWNNDQKRMEPWVEVVFDDDTELKVRLETVLTKSIKVPVNLVERIAEDKSYSAGKVELAEVKDYSRSGTGVYKKLKVTQAEYTYRIKLPDTQKGPGKEIVVGREVINW